MRKGGEEISDPANVYFNSVKHLWGLALAANKAGDTFPIWVSKRTEKAMSRGVAGLE